MVKIILQDNNTSYDIFAVKDDCLLKLQGGWKIYYVCGHINHSVLYEEIFNLLKTSCKLLDRWDDAHERRLEYECPDSIVDVLGIDDVRLLWKYLSGELSLDDIRFYRIGKDFIENSFFRMAGDVAVLSFVVPKKSVAVVGKKVYVFRVNGYRSLIKIGKILSGVKVRLRNNKKLLCELSEYVDSIKWLTKFHGVPKDVVDALLSEIYKCKLIQ